MESSTINIVNVIGDVYGVEAEDGQKVFDLIKKSFSKKHKVIVSFKNVEILTTAFLNTAIGQLYKEYTEDFVKENLSVADISDSGKVSLKRVVDTAKRYYKDPEAMQRSIDDILDD